ncbi:MAG: hypothetical protein Q9222_005305 [Ikaeria aurantiellina]
MDIEGFQNRSPLAKAATYALKTFIIKELIRSAEKDQAIKNVIHEISNSVGSNGLENIERVIEKLIDKARLKYATRGFNYTVHQSDHSIESPKYYEEKRDNHIANNDLLAEDFVFEACCWVSKSLEEEAKYFRFMDLPNELRCMVYEYLLHGIESCISVKSYRKYTRTPPRIEYKEPRYDSSSRLHWSFCYSEFKNLVHEDQPKDISVAVLRVSKGIHMEAERLLYNSRTFDFGHVPEAATAFLGSLSENARLNASGVRIDLYHSSCGRFGSNERKWATAINYLAKNLPHIQLSSRIELEMFEDEYDLIERPFARALGRLKGIRSLTRPGSEGFVRQLTEKIDAAKKVKSSWPKYTCATIRISETGDKSMQKP